MKVHVKTTDAALDRICDAQVMHRAQVQVLFGFVPAALESTTIQKIVDLALSLDLDVTLHENEKIVSISA